MINANYKNNYNPDLDSIPKKVLSSADIMYLCFPSNPQGATTDLNYLIKAINLAREYNFIIAFDECYIDIYRLNKSKPVGH